MSHITFTSHKLPTKHNVQYEKLRKNNDGHEYWYPSDDLDAMQSPLSESFQRSKKTRKNWILTGMGIALSFLVVVLVAQLVLLSLQYKTRHSHKYDHNLQLLIAHEATQYKPATPCGSTAVEARARGCRFSWALGSWLPDACYDSAIEMRFTKDYKFEFYYRNETGVDKADLTRPISSPDELSEVPHGEITFTTWRYHFQHCMAAWHYVHRAGMYHMKVSSLLAPVGHTHHCMMMILDEEIAPDNLATKAVNTFPDCVRLEDFRNAMSYS